MNIEALKDAFVSVKEHFSANPEKAVEADSFAEAVLQEGLVTAVHGPSGQHVTSDMPKGIGGGASAPTPGWYLRAGVASCTATVIALRAAELDVALDSLSVRIESRSNNCGMVGLDDSVPAGPLEAKMTVSLASVSAEAAVLREIAAWGIAHSPMADTLTRAVPMEVVVEAE